MQVNQPPSGTAEAITTPLAVGDTVSYVAISGGGRSYRFSARKAVIQAIDGNVATLRSANGRTTKQPLSKLTPDGQPNTLTRMLMGGQPEPINYGELDPVQRLAVCRGTPFAVAADGRKEEGNDHV
ncbi:hypothetical protein [Pseudomonas sp. CFBP13506]|uniref:hypothetical protein n=1 Tax=Pseudomonas sp. CFBP13506 TaxID=2184010 RepID=UPI001F4F2550|nr:hypothetical protein [Pseudomonas sp. CFBP13506]